MNKYTITAKGSRILVNDDAMAVDVNHADLAQLLAAAPELLDAARLANEELLALGVGSSASPAIRALWAAIAKAEGRN
jgi:hypothetical protein